MMMFLLACAAHAPPVDSAAASADTSTDTNLGDTADSAEPTPEGLHGVAPEEPVPVPEFSATNRDGAPRSSVDLVGHPTVVWFYPLANTAG